MNFLREMADRTITDQPAETLSDRILTALFALEIIYHSNSGAVKQYVDRTRGHYDVVGPSSPVLHNWISAGRAKFSIDKVDQYLIKLLSGDPDRLDDLVGVQISLGPTPGVNRKIRRSVENWSGTWNQSTNRSKTIELITPKILKYVPKTDDLFKMWQEIV